MNFSSTKINKQFLNIPKDVFYNRLYARATKFFLGTKFKKFRHPCIRPINRLGMKSKASGFNTYKVKFKKNGNDRNASLQMQERAKSAYGTV